MFFALAANLGYPVYGGDAQDAYAHSPPPETPTFVQIDDAYADWYFARYNKQIDRKLVLPVQHALQGHPESGRLWEATINKILSSNPLQFKSTTHSRTIYSTTFDGHHILLLRQVDDFALACPTESIAKNVYEIIGRALQLPEESAPPFKYLGLINDFNGVDVNQHQGYIEITANSYISRLLKSHGWDTPNNKEAESDNIAPLPMDSVDTVYNSDPGPSEGTPEHSALHDSQGFGYRTVLGELLYAYVTARPDIGYSIVTLSKFAAAPAPLHYRLLKGIAKYLRRTSHWGIRYKRPHLVDHLPPDQPYDIPLDPTLPPFPSTALHELTGYVDAAHANDLRNRRSTTGYGFILSNAVIAYRSKTQSVTATSSTEAEFIAAVLAAKMARYLRSVLTELNFPPEGPTLIYEDNLSAIQIINARQPTDRSRHIDIQYFAIQDWKENGDILLAHIPGIINPADDLTKPLGWILHARHSRRLMGHYA
jgi:hypothetical protein